MHHNNPQQGKLCRRAGPSRASIILKEVGFFEVAVTLPQTSLLLSLTLHPKGSGIYQLSGPGSSAPPFLLSARILSHLLPQTATTFHSHFCLSCCPTPPFNLFFAQPSSRTRTAPSISWIGLVNRKPTGRDGSKGIGNECPPPIPHTLE